MTRLEECTVAQVDLLLSPATRTALHPEARAAHYRGLTFAMISRAMAGLEQLVGRQQATFPVCLFMLLGPEASDVAAKIMSIPLCLLDGFARTFIQRHSRTEGLLSIAARMELLPLATVHRMETIKIECRHASSRRQLASRAQAPGRSLASVSALFLLSRARRIEHAPWAKSGASSSDAKRRSRQVMIRRRRFGVFKGGRAGGGGARRAALSHYWKELQSGGAGVSREERRRRFQEAHARADAEPLERRQLWQAVGEVGAASHKVGGPSLGRRLRRHVGRSTSLHPLLPSGKGTPSSREILYTSPQESRLQVAVSAVQAGNRKREEDAIASQALVRSWAQTQTPTS